MASNQTEAEFFALVSTGTKSVENIFSSYRDKIIQRSAQNLRIDGAFDVWASRVIFELASDEKLVPALNTKKGVISAYQCINQAAIDGIQIGGSKPQAYFVNRGGEICLDIADRGMEFVCVYGPGAVLEKVPKLIKIYDGDDVRVDEAEGRIIYPKEGTVKIFGNGKLAGYAMELEYLDGRREVVRVTLDKCRQIEDKYGQKNSPLYTKSPEEADEKTARKQLLKRPFQESEGRAMAMALGLAPMQEVPQEVTEPPPRDVGDRMAAHLERKTSAMTATDAAKEAAQDADIVSEIDGSVGTRKEPSTPPPTERMVSDPEAETESDGEPSLDIF